MKKTDKGFRVYAFESQRDSCNGSILPRKERRHEEEWDFSLFIALSLSPSKFYNKTAVLGGDWEEVLLRNDA